MSNLYWLIGGLAVVELLKRPAIGKIVPGGPEGVTPCFDGEFSTHVPGPGVCSYHGGWKGVRSNSVPQETDRVLMEPVSNEEMAAFNNQRLPIRDLAVWVRRLVKNLYPKASVRLERMVGGEQHVAIWHRDPHQLQGLGRLLFENCTGTGEYWRAKLLKPIRYKDQKIYLSPREVVYVIKCWKFNQASIGKIVHAKPPGVTQCLDESYSTYLPGRGVCSHHGGWRGGRMVKAVEPQDAIVESAPLPQEEPVVAIDINSIKWGTKVRLTEPFQGFPAGKIGEVADAPRFFLNRKEEKDHLYVEFGFTPAGVMASAKIPVYILEVVALPDRRAWMNKKPQLPPPPADIYIEDIDYELARRAYNGTSMRAEKRGRDAVVGHRKELVELYRDLAKGRTPEQLSVLTVRWMHFVNRYTKLKVDFLRHHSGLMSTMVTGPARFPVARQRKLSEQNDKKRSAMYDFWNKFIKSIESHREIYPENLGTEPVKSGSDSAAEELQVQLNDRVELQNKYKLANKLLKRSAKDDEFVAAGLPVAWVVKNLHGYGHKRIAPYLLTNNNAQIRRLKARIAEEQSIQAQRSAGQKEVAFPGGTVSEDHADNRLRIFFDEIPSADDRTKLKKSGWKWSRKNVAWQRQLTANAWRSAKYILNIPD